MTLWLRPYVKFDRLGSINKLKGFVKVAWVYLSHFIKWKHIAYILAHIYGVQTFTIGFWNEMTLFLYKNCTVWKNYNDYWCITRLDDRVWNQHFVATNAVTELAVGWMDPRVGLVLTILTNTCVALGRAEQSLTC